MDSTQHFNSQGGEQKQPAETSGLEQSHESTTLHDDPHSEAYMTTQVASQNIIEIMDDDNSIGEDCWASLEDITTPGTTSSSHFQDNSQFNVVDYFNEGLDEIPAVPTPTFVNSYEITEYSSQSCSLLDSFQTEDSPLCMLDTSDGVLNNDSAMNVSITKSSIVSADMCSVNNQLSQFLGQHSNGSSPEIIDLTDDTDETDDEEMTLAPMPELIDLSDIDETDDVPMSLAPRKNITLVLDLDGTLIHSQISADGADFSFPMRLGEKEYTLYVKKRPHVDTFLEEVAQMFELVVFTASISSYANQLLDVLDPENRLISRRFYRESCLRVDGSFRKDLTIVKSDLAKVAIIDNTPEVFQLQVNNGIPIETWSSDPFDFSLIELIPFLETLAVADDVRPIIANKFMN